MDDIRLVDADKMIAELEAVRDSFPNCRIYENGIYDGLGCAMETIDCAPTIDAIPAEKWRELKELIINMRDNGGNGTQQEVCRFLANLIEVIERK